MVVMETTLEGSSHPLPVWVGDLTEEGPVQILAQLHWPLSAQLWGARLVALTQPAGHPVPMLGCLLQVGGHHPQLQVRVFDQHPVQEGQLHVQAFHMVQVVAAGDYHHRAVEVNGEGFTMTVQVVEVRPAWRGPHLPIEQVDEEGLVPVGAAWHVRMPGQPDDRDHRGPVRANSASAVSAFR